MYRSNRIVGWVFLIRNYEFDYKHYTDIKLEFSRKKKLAFWIRRRIINVKWSYEVIFAYNPKTRLVWNGKSGTC